MNALNELRRHLGLDWKAMGREKARTHLRESLQRISAEEEKMIARVGASSAKDLDRMLVSGQIKGKEGTAALHQYTRLCSLSRLAQRALEELDAPDPDAIEDEFEGIKQY